jgi:hypothetical protein
VSDGDVESYKQIKSDLDVLRQSVEKSELWVYKSKSAEEHGNKKKNKDDEEEVVTERKSSPKKTPPSLSSSDKQGSAIDLDIGPPIHMDQAEEYKKIQQVCTHPVIIQLNSIVYCLCAESTATRPISDFLFQVAPQLHCIVLY